ncbi:MAG: NfeD family protein [Methylophilaceae bacterium]|nr:NfeD family protein [Methylophilaceae bacterium]MDG1445136.1 NfeD family protein [Methylophilaceae bacterium]MDG1820260.1 NfeD family protein [Methylophilaceae bacterium]
MIEAVWVWAAFGIILLTIEMTLVGTLDVLWFGIAALCVALVVWLFPDISRDLQLILFAVIALVSLAVWRGYYKKNEPHSRIGQSQGEEIGRIGNVIEPCSPSQAGRIQFTQGLMGAREWTAVSDELIDAGTKATVTAVEGNALRIKAV